jgi:cell division protein FtsI/penicillin-binding protein 2
MQMGGGEINQKARDAWHDYMANHFQLGKKTGIEQGYESAGVVPDPDKGYGLNVTYANTAFGQGMTATPLQMAGAFASVVNGGIYYKPHLVAKEIGSDGKESVTQPATVGRAIKPDVSKTMRDMLVNTLYENRVTYGASLVSTSVVMGGKTGTAQIANPKGGYYDDRFNGTYLGFVGGSSTDKPPQYVVVIQMIEPHVTGYAGAKAAAPTFLQIAQVLINNFGVVSKQ